MFASKAEVSASRRRLRGLGSDEEEEERLAEEEEEEPRIASLASIWRRRISRDIGFGGGARIAGWSDWRVGSDVMVDALVGGSAAARVVAVGSDMVGLTGKTGRVSSSILSCSSCCSRYGWMTGVSSTCGGMVGVSCE